MVRGISMVPMTRPSRSISKLVCASASHVQSRSSWTRMAMIHWRMRSEAAAKVIAERSGVSVWRSAPAQPNTMRRPRRAVNVTPVLTRPSCCARRAAAFDGPGCGSGWRKTACICWPARRERRPVRLRRRPQLDENGARLRRALSVRSSQGRVRFADGGKPETHRRARDGDGPAPGMGLRRSAPSRAARFLWSWLAIWRSIERAVVVEIAERRRAENSLGPPPPRRFRRRTSTVISSWRTSGSGTPTALGVASI